MTADANNKWHQRRGLEDANCTLTTCLPLKHLDGSDLT